MGFVNLHGHSEHSHLDAIIRVKDLFARAKQLGQKAIALTDHGVMAGVWEAYNEFKKTGVKFIPGNEIYFTDDLTETSSRRGHLILLATNEKGYRNLLKLTAKSFDHPVTIMGKIFPRIDIEMLKAHNEGIVATSACMSSLLADSIFHEEANKAEELALLLKSIFGNRFFIELQPHNLRFVKKDKRTGSILQYSQVELNNKLKEIAERNHINMVATCDSHYLVPEHEEYHDMIQAISSKKSVSDLNRKRYAIREPCTQCGGHGTFPIDSKTKCQPCEGSGIGNQIPCPEYYLKNEEQIFDYFSKLYSPDFAKKLISNTSRIADLCEEPKYIEPTGVRLPVFNMKYISQNTDCQEFCDWKSGKASLAGKADDALYLRFKCLRAFRDYCANFDADTKKIYWDRILNEIDVLESRNFCSYMLIVADTINWAKNQGMYLGPGRGSGGGSLVGFLLGIHEADPIKYGLVFERFVNKFKKALPDYDMDFPTSRRDEVFKYVQDKYGENHVAYISNISKLTPKVAIKDIARSLQVGGDKSIAFALANKVTADIPDIVNINGKDVEVETMDLALQFSEELRKFVKEYPQISEYAKHLVGLPRNFSTHAAGVVISDVPLDEYIPLRRDDEGKLAVQYDKTAVEDNGFVKMDFLALKTLDIMEETYESSSRIGIALPKYSEIPDNDIKAYKLIQSGKVLGLFQLDGGTISSLCRPMQPASIEDIALINALGRPNCSKEERAEFIERRFGRSKPVPPHEILKDVLAKTNGICVYDEDLLRIGQHVAGWDLAKADDLRKLTKYKAKHPEFAEQLEKDFMTGAVEHSKLSKKDAQFIWEKVVLPFSGYGFNKSHAINYSILGYRTAYYKAHSPAAFLCAVLNSRTDSNARNRDDKIDAVKEDIKQFGIEICPCSINESNSTYTVVSKKKIVTGLGAIDGLGEKALQDIVSKRPFISFEDFLYRTSSTAVNKTAIQSLAKAGAFDCLGVNRKYAHDAYELIRDALKGYVEDCSDEYFQNGDRTKPYENYLQGFDAYFQNKLEQKLARATKKGADFIIPNKAEEWSVKEKMIYEKEVLGEYLSGSIDQLYPGFFKGGQWTQSFSAVKSLPKNYPIPMEGLVISVKELAIKNGKNAGDKFAKLVVENVKGETIEVTLWSEFYKKFKDKLLKGNVPIRGMFKTSEYNGEISLQVDRTFEVYGG